MFLFICLGTILAFRKYFVPVNKLGIVPSRDILSVVGHFLVGFYSITTKHIREKNFETQQKQFGKYCEGNFGYG